MPYIKSVDHYQNVQKYFNPKSQKPSKIQNTRKCQISADSKNSPKNPKNSTIQNIPKLPNQNSKIKKILRFSRPKTRRPKIQENVKYPRIPKIPQKPKKSRIQSIPELPNQNPKIQKIQRFSRPKTRRKAQNPRKCQISADLKNPPKNLESKTSPNSPIKPQNSKNLAILTTKNSS